MTHGHAGPISAEREYVIPNTKVDLSRQQVDDYTKSYPAKQVLPKPEPRPLSDQARTTGFSRIY